MEILLEIAKKFVVVFFLYNKTFYIFHWNGLKFKLYELDNELFTIYSSLICKSYIFCQFLFNTLIFRFNGPWGKLKPKFICVYLIM